jgi:uncharacterized double-CXXCG motif protein
MKLFFIEWVLDINPSVEADHRWALPWVECPKCHVVPQGAWLAYPDILLSEFIDSNSLRKYPSEDKAGDVSWEEFQRLAAPIRERLGSDFHVGPNTCFGPMKGKLLYRHGDFVWSASGQLLLPVQTAGRLLDAGISDLVLCPTEILDRKRNRVELHEIRVDICAELSERSYPKGKAGRCSVCQHRLHKQSACRVSARIIDGSPNLFRIRDVSRWIVCTERFKETVERLGLSDIGFKEIQVVND